MLKYHRPIDLRQLAPCTRAGVSSASQAVSCSRRPPRRRVSRGDGPLIARGVAEGRRKGKAHTP
jgi:hypothetical protein